MNYDSATNAYDPSDYNWTHTGTFGPLFSSESTCSSNAGMNRFGVTIRKKGNHWKYRIFESDNEMLPVDKL